MVFSRNADKLMAPSLSAAKDVTQHHSNESLELDQTQLTRQRESGSESLSYVMVFYHREHA